MSGQSPYMSAAQYTYASSFPQRDVRYVGNPTMDVAMGLNRRPTLLGGYHNNFSSSERAAAAPYYLSVAPVSMGPHVDEHSKRSRHPTLRSQISPLSVEVKKEQPLYQPQTEAISPTLDDVKIDSPMRDTSIIRNSICKLESDIESTMKRLNRAKLSQNEIKNQADRSAVDDEENDDSLQTNDSQTMIEKILHDNRKKAEDGQKVLNQLNNYLDLSIPLYQEPSDLESIENIRKQYMSVMKNRLINSFKKSRERYMSRTKFDSEKYDQIYREWQKSIEKEEKSILLKDASTYRDTFEKTFPDLRKAREDKEKKQSIHAGNESSVSLAEPQQVPPSASLATTEQDNDEEDEEKMRKSSVIPPIMHDRWQRKHQYFNENGLIKRDAALFYKESTEMSKWSDEERQIFVERFTQSPKNFGYISSFLENRTTEQCIQFYYMTKKQENYKNLLRKHTLATRRRAKQQTTSTLTTTTVTSSTTIETTLVTKVTSSNTIVSSSSKRMLGSANRSGQNNERLADRIDNDDERRELNSGDANEEKRSNKNRCQFLSCNSSGRKRSRKNRSHAFPTEWNELTDDDRAEIRRSLQIPQDVHRCCTRCYNKLIAQVRQRHANQALEDEDDDEENLDESINSSSTKHGDDEWTAAELDMFTQALAKFNYNWRKIADYVQRSEPSCRALYKKQQKLISPDENLDEDNASVSGSELGQVKRTGDDEGHKVMANEDSNDSPRAMIIDEGDETSSLAEETTSQIRKSAAANLEGSNLTTITSLVEKEISKTLSETEKRLSISYNHSQALASERPIHPNVIPSPPPPLEIPVKPQSPGPHAMYSSHPQAYAHKGSIMRGTPLAASTPANKPIAIDTSPALSHHPGSHRHDYPPLKSPKVLDRNLEQQQLLQHHQQHANYLRHYAQQKASSTQFLPPPPPPAQQQQHQQHPYQQQHKNSSGKMDPSNANTFETLKADFMTSKYLATTHSPSHERHHRGGPEQPSPRRPPSSNGQAFLPPPAAIVSSTANPSSVPPSMHAHHAQQSANYHLAASQLLASSGMYPQDLLNSDLLPYASYYGSLPSGAPFLFDPRLMHQYAAVNPSHELFKAEQQQAAMRSSRHYYAHAAGQTPPEGSYPTHSSKRSMHESNVYANPDYPASLWRAQGMNANPHLKSSHGMNENSAMKLNELPRHSSPRVSAASERNSRSPDDHPRRRGNQPHPAVESPSLHFQRADAQSHHKLSHDGTNPNMHFLDHPTDGNSSGYMRQPMHISKSQPPHRPYPNPTSHNRAPMVPSPLPNPSHHSSSYMMQGLHHSPVGSGVSPQRQQQQQQQQPQQQSPSPHPPPPHMRQSHHFHQQRGAPSNEALRNFKDGMSIQEFMYKRVNEFVGSGNPQHPDASAHVPALHSSGRVHQSNNADQPILIDVDDAGALEHPDVEGNARNANRSAMESEMPERRRVSSIKKILSNQPLDKQEYVEINQRVQSSAGNASKLQSLNDPSGLERSNSTSGRTRSGGSITMRMLMGAQDIYADGKAQSISGNDDKSTKRSLSPNGHHPQIEYLIRDELDRACPTLVKRDETGSIFQKPSASQSPNASKRLRTSPKDDESRYSTVHQTHESPTSRDPFALQPHSKSQQPTSTTGQAERHWQSYAQQQQYQHSPASSFASRSARPPSGSISQGSPIPSSSIRSAAEQGQYPSATNNQLINPRYPYYINKNDQQHPLSRQSSSPPHEYPPADKVARPASHQASVSPSDVHPESSPLISDAPPSSVRTSPVRSVSVNLSSGQTPPLISSPTPSASSNSAHSLKKRLINEYELEQQRSSPMGPTSAAAKDTVDETAPTDSQESTSVAAVPDDERAEDAVPDESMDDAGKST